MLMAHGDFVLTDNIPANEFMNLEGSKQSKSKGHAILVKDVVTKFNPDSIRYAIASNMPENKDTDFYWEDLQSKNNNELGAILGNFVNRTFVFVHKYFEGMVPKSGELLEIDRNMLESLKPYSERAASYYETYHFKDAVNETMNAVRDANKYFNDTEPWKAVKENKERCGTIMNICLQLVHSFAVFFNPITPFASEKMFNMLNINKDDFLWDNIYKMNLKAGHKLNQPEILFKKIEDTEIES
jgi:methionyl-tRNA synthetase